MILKLHKLSCETSGIAIYGNGNGYDILFQKDKKTQRLDKKGEVM